MKNSGNCHKCDSRKIIKIPGKKYQSPGDNAIPACWLNTGLVPVTRYLRCHCGYSEEWIVDLEHIKKLENSYDRHELDDYV